MSTVGQVRMYNGLPSIRKCAMALTVLAGEFEATFKDYEISPDMRLTMLDIEIVELVKVVNELHQKVAGCLGSKE